MAVFRHHAAQLRVQRHRSGLALVSYSGPMGEDTFSVLRERAIQAVAGACALLVDTRGVLLLRSEASKIQAGTFMDNCAPPAAIIASDAAWRFWRSYTDCAADHGVIRAVFTSSDPALDWLGLWVDPASVSELRPQQIALRMNPQGTPDSLR